ncbi:hypothetical protein BS78_09G114400 [Paspalum vaginatum]|nr:hypothetical protein BS78_09G114400 [Paspalum vaginatum]
MQGGLCKQCDDDVPSWSFGRCVGKVPYGAASCTCTHARLHTSTTIGREQRASLAGLGKSSSPLLVNCYQDHEERNLCRSTDTKGRTEKDCWNCMPTLLLLLTGTISPIAALFQMGSSELRTSYSCRHWF